MKTKKLASYLLSSLLLTSVLAGCAQGTNSSSKTSSSQGSAQSSSQSSSKAVSKDSAPISQNASSKTQSDTNGKTIVVYYSASGNTKAVGDIIAKEMNADVFEIVPTSPYTAEDLDWTNTQSRVSTEHDNEESRNTPIVNSTVENWDDYSTVYIGFPIWWGIAAWPTDTFVSANDFTGKKVIPFATAASSGFNDSGDLLSKLAGTGDWVKGECFRGASQDEIILWAKEAAK